MVWRGLSVFGIAFMMHAANAAGQDVLGPPETQIDAAPPAAAASGDGTVAFSSPGALTPPVFECRLDAASTPLWQTCESPFAFSSLADGAHLFEVRAVDPLLGADPTPAQATWAVDTTPPTVAIDIATSGVVSSGTAAFAFSSDDAAASFRCALDGGAPAPCESPAQYTDLAVGDHVFAVTATDAAGNTSQPATADWQVESPPPPELPFLPPPEGQPQAEPEAAPQPEPQPSRSGGKRPPRVTHRSNERTRTWWSYVRRDSAVYTRPSRSAKRKGRIGRYTYYGLDDVVVVLKRRARWTKIRYAGLGRRAGWVWTGALSRPRLTRTRIVIDRKRFTLTAFRNGERVFKTRVGVGAKGSPTPAGRFFMRERLVPRDKDGIYGALAWGTSTYSRYRTDWPGGGQVGIHGTNQPGLIPGRISNGCVRLRNRAILRLDRIVRRGTPVRIR